MGNTGPQGVLTVTNTATSSTSGNVSYSVLSTDEYLRADTTFGLVIYTLPAANSGNLGKVYYFKLVASYPFAMVITASASQTIDGQGSKTFTAVGSEVTLVSNGSGWDILSEFPSPAVALLA
jgi:hypothetical protein